MRPPLTPLDALETLRQVNVDLSSALLRLRPERKRCSAIRPQDFSDIRAQLLRAAESLRLRPQDPGTAAALETEVRKYRGNLEQLKRFLPDLHLRLLAEKSRIDTARTHLAAAATWAKAKGQ
jgi:hypothetical protein